MRFFPMPRRPRAWPAGPPPTVPPAGPPAFHCPRCRRPVDDSETTCVACGEDLLGEE